MVADYKVTPCRNPAITARLLFFINNVFSIRYTFSLVMLERSKYG